MEAAGAGDVMLGGSLVVGAAAAPAAIGRCDEVAYNLNKMEKALRGTFLELRSSSNEATTRPANGHLIHALQSFSANGDHTIEPHCRMLQCWASELEKDVEMMWQGDRGRKYLLLLNNIYGVLQMMRRPGATFANAQLVNRLNSLIQTYKKSYFDECWVPLLHLNLDKFAAAFLATCGNQRAWKVTAELKYKLREEILDLIVPLYEVSFIAPHANRSRLSDVLCSFERVILGNKKQKKFTREELAEEIRAIFEG